MKTSYEVPLFEVYHVTQGCAICSAATNEPYDDQQDYSGNEGWQ